MPKAISQHGIELLEELSRDRKDFHEGKHDLQQARGNIGYANATCGAMRSTLQAQKYETAIKIAAA
jgi:hypothetical protein